jgi:hypothetical protein
MDLNRIEWRKASYSTGNGGACVEVGVGPHLVAVRDSKDPDGPRLAFSADAWDTFIRQTKRQQPGPA